MFTPRNQRQNIGRAVLNVGGVYFLDFFWTKKSQGLIYQHSCPSISRFYPRDIGLRLKTHDKA